MYICSSTVLRYSAFCQFIPLCDSFYGLQSLQATYVLSLLRRQIFTRNTLKRKPTAGLCSNLASGHFGPSNRSFSQGRWWPAYSSANIIIVGPSSFCYTSPVASLLLPAFTTLACHITAAQFFMVSGFPRSSLVLHPSAVQAFVVSVNQRFRQRELCVYSTHMPYLIHPTRSTEAQAGHAQSAQANSAMPNPGFGSSQEEDESRKVSPPAGDVELTKKRRTTVRSQITSTIRQIRASIDQCGSRGSIAGLVKHLQSLATTATLLHTDLLIVEDASENERQEEKHLMYVQQIGEVIAEADEHLKSRADEAPSEVDGGRAARVTEQEIRAAKQLIEQTRTQAEQARKRAEELQIQPQQAEEAPQDLQQGDANPENFSSVSNRGGSFTKLAADWKRKQAQQNTASDDWIDG
ncbi:hypothetical protein DAPPUDRAFT_336361, partial [Daphnia pulex]